MGAGRELEGFGEGFAAGNSGGVASEAIGGHFRGRRRARRGAKSARWAKLLQSEETCECSKAVLPGLPFPPACHTA